MPLDPVETTRAISDSYFSYLATTFNLKDDSLRQQFLERLGEPKKLIYGPILEATAPFESGRSVEELIQEGVLSSRFRDLGENAFPLRRPLYRHQDEAVRRIVAEARNVVVATGTGSGKTEAFLLPVLNHLLEQEEAGELEPGVRALLLYPMNALANDQLSRLRDLLSDYPAITFGRYTGETETKYSTALEKYRRTFQREPRPNELISREQMRGSPPHFLLTNYAMLEYLLLRPNDNAFFDGDMAGNWRFIILDEAHTYSGAKGIEMAMLLRRLKDRVARGRSDALRCIATSATLGASQESLKDIAEFASELFSETFEWLHDDNERQDIVVGSRRLLARSGARSWLPDPDVYGRWLELRGKDIEALVEAGSGAGIPGPVIARAEQIAQNDEKSFFYVVLEGDGRLRRLQQMLERGPVVFQDAAGEVFSGHPSGDEYLASLVELAASARPSSGDQPLLPARYHLFVRALDGAFIKLSPDREVFLERHGRVESDGESSAVFELASCRQCGAAYLVGEIEEESGRTYLRQAGKRFFEDPGHLEFFYMPEGVEDKIPDDEDEEVRLGQEREADEDLAHQLCTGCGALDERSLLGGLCDCDPNRHLTLVKVSSKGGRVHVCPACGARSPTGLVWRFLPGNDATASVLATAFYQKIPPRELEVQPDPGKGEEARSVWSTSRLNRNGESSTSAATDPGSQLLVFSDSRQDAAFFAPYLSRSYSRILRRRLLLKTLEEHSEAVRTEKWRVQDLLEPVRRLAQVSGLFNRESIREQRTEIWKWLLFELLAMDRRNSLEGLGSLGFKLAKPDRWSPPGPMIEWGFNEVEAWDLFEILIGTFRIKGAIDYPDEVSPDDEFFKPRNQEIYFRGNGASPKKHILSWVPTRSGVLNSRLDYLARALRRVWDRDVDSEEARAILAKIWDHSLELGDPNSCWRDQVTAKRLPGEGVVYQVKSDCWEVVLGPRGSGAGWYHCGRCNRVTPTNVRGVCPTYRCDGNLEPCDPAEVFKRNHYRQLYSNLRPAKLVAREHTAQLTGEAAAELQTEFISGGVNVLSCSTTFELGVDVGQLESVFMRNVPPSTANYVQRAGRAGRRTSSTAFALTFARRTPHDFSHFSEPRRLICGEIAAPHFKVANEKIVRRHLYATALGAFWKTEPGTFGRVDSFCVNEDNDGLTLLEAFLARRPANLSESLQRIVPKALMEDLGLKNWGWVTGLTGPGEGVLWRAVEEIKADLETLSQAREQLARENRPSDFLLRRENTIKKRYLLSFLSSRNVIPKYGFPVDVVELQIAHHSEAANRLELSRDLRIALSEYAPGAQVVAANRLWSSQYLKKFPNRDWLRYRYAVCDVCGYYQCVLAESDALLEECAACRQPLRGRNRGVFVVPEFGFITSTKNPGRPGEERPRRTFSTRVYFAGEPDSSESLEVDLGGLSLAAFTAKEGELAVVNHAGFQGFKICRLCGFGIRGSDPAPSPHPTPWKTNCRGTLNRVFLGHMFKTDVLQLRFSGYSNPDRGFWLSLLYAVLEGSSEALEIDRNDLGGCLYPYDGDPSRPALVLFDEVPGGAGHVRRIARDESSLRNVLRAAWSRLTRCQCGGEERDTSCYGCLRDYRNQYCHDELARGPVIEFLESTTG